MSLLKKFTSRLETYSNEKITTAILGFAVFLVIVAFFIWRSNKNLSPTYRLPITTVAVTTFPLSDIVKNVGGEVIRVQALTPEGRSPLDKTISLTEDTLKEVDLVFGFGQDIDSWILDEVESESLKIVSVDSKVEMELAQTSFTNENGANIPRLLDGNDPYYWVSPVNALVIAGAVAEALVEEYPEYAEVIDVNIRDYSKRLGKLDREVRTELQNYTGVELITVGHQWRHLARDYSLNIRTEIGFPEQESDFEKVFQQAVSEEPKVVYVSPGIPVEKIKPAADLHSTALIVLDAFGGVEGRATYDELVKYNIKQITNWN